MNIFRSLQQIGLVSVASSSETRLAPQNSPPCINSGTSGEAGFCLEALGMMMQSKPNLFLPSFPYLCTMLIVDMVNILFDVYLFSRNEFYIKKYPQHLDSFPKKPLEVSASTPPDIKKSFFSSRDQQILEVSFSFLEINTSSISAVSIIGKMVSKTGTWHKSFDFDLPNVHHHQNWTT